MDVAERGVAGPEGSEEAGACPSANRRSEGRRAFRFPQADPGRRRGGRPRAAQPVRGGGPAGGPPAVAPAAAVAIRLARLPPERLGQLLPPDADGPDGVRRFAAPCRLPGPGCEEQGDRRVPPRRPAASTTCTARSRSGATAVVPRTSPTRSTRPARWPQAHEVFGRLRELVPEERRAILEMKAEGLSSKEIGERLGISERTVQRVLEDLTAAHGVGVGGTEMNVVRQSADVGGGVVARRGPPGPRDSSRPGGLDRRGRRPDPRTFLDRRAPSRRRPARAWRSSAPTSSLRWEAGERVGARVVSRPLPRPRAKTRSSP